MSTFLPVPFSSPSTRDVNTRYEQTMSLLTSLELLSSTDYFIGSFRSNMHLLITLLRGAKGYNPSTTYNVEKQEFDPIY